ncbi:LysR family transcriptional regulator [Vibrio sonorensis]|uniref:LysR family transcriptional regulator n=1 Tax=Vibrio sonorensis TaxID=1004316 RepID=UPI0008DA305E|nr:LysR family transcriptional regulator [Vibrio sonorensis]
MYHQVPPMNAMVAFDAVVKTGSVSAAAQMLNISSPAVSQRIKSLEAWFSCPLFSRKHGKLVLTEQGKTLADSSSKAFDQLFSTSRKMKEKVSSDDITISVLPSFAYLCLMDKLNAFLTAYPHINVHIETTTRRSDFRSQHIDLSIRYSFREEPEGLKMTKFAEEVVFPCASPDLIERLGTVDIQELIAGSALIMDSCPEMLNVKPGWPQWFSAFIPEASIEGMRKVSFHHSHFEIDSAIKGQGVVLARSRLARQAIESGQLIRLSDDHLPISASYYLVERKGVPLKPNAREFAKWFLDTFSEYD